MKKEKAYRKVSLMVTMIVSALAVTPAFVFASTGLQNIGNTILSSPATGDESKPWVWALVIIVAVAIIIYIGIYTAVSSRKRKRKRK